MDSDRKYSQRGYQDNDRRTQDRAPSGSDQRKPQGPKLPLDVTGPKLPRLVQNVVAARCFSCATTIPSTTDFSQASCPKCSTALHCCKQCAHFEPSTRFQCLKPVLARIAVKDQHNDCASFSSRVTVAREATGSSGNAPVQQPQSAASIQQHPPRNAQDARAAFDSLFKK